MYRRRRVHVAYFFATLLLLIIIFLSRRYSIGRVLGFSVTCRETDESIVSTLRRVRTNCSSWPHQNSFFVAQGVLNRNNRVKSARCYQISLDSRSGQVISDASSSIHSTLLRIECHEDGNHKGRPMKLFLPAIPPPSPQERPVGHQRKNDHWDIVVIGVGGLTHRVWTAAMPQSLELVQREMSGSISLKLTSMSLQSETDLRNLLFNNGKWITEEFSKRGFKTQAAILNHESQSASQLSPPSTFNLSSYLSERISLKTPGCVGMVPEGSIGLSWVREMMLLFGSRHKVFSFLHFSDIIFPSIKRLDSELVSFLLEYLHFEGFSNTALFLYSLPDERSGYEPGMLIVHPPPQLADTFRWDMLRSAFGVDDQFTMTDLNRALAFLASDQKPSILAPIGRDLRSCYNLNIDSRICQCLISS